MVSHSKFVRLFQAVGNMWQSLKFFPSPTNTIQPQNEYIEQSRKRHGYRLDHFEKKYVLNSAINPW